MRNKERRLVERDWGLRQSPNFQDGLSYGEKVYSPILWWTFGDIPISANVAVEHHQISTDNCAMATNHVK